MKLRHTRVMAPVAALVGAAALVAGCGGSDSTATTTSSTTATTTTTAVSAHKAALLKPAAVELTVKSTKYGEVLFNQDGQVVYAFENDTVDTSNCFDDCADFWPPVLAEGDPTVASGLDADKVGVIDRPDGGRQVTYNGLPLYYMDEPAGEIHCQAMDMHGGLWWVVDSTGTPVTSA